MCYAPFLLSPLWWAHYLAGLATASALAWSGGGRLRSRSPLLRLHVATLHTRSNAGQRPPYEMHGPTLRVVK